jgi:hypothetical protein
VKPGASDNRRDRWLAAAARDIPATWSPGQPRVQTLAGAGALHLLLFAALIAAPPLSAPRPDALRVEIITPPPPSPPEQQEPPPPRPAAMARPTPTASEPPSPLAEPLDETLAARAVQTVPRRLSAPPAPVLPIAPQVADEQVETAAPVIRTTPGRIAAPNAAAALPRVDAMPEQTLAPREARLAPAAPGIARPQTPALARIGPMTEQQIEVRDPALRPGEPPRTLDRPAGPALPTIDPRLPPGAIDAENPPAASMAEEELRRAAEEAARRAAAGATPGAGAPGAGTAAPGAVVLAPGGGGGGGGGGQPSGASAPPGSGGNASPIVPAGSLPVGRAPGGLLERVARDAECARLGRTPEECERGWQGLPSAPSPRTARPTIIAPPPGTVLRDPNRPAMPEPLPVCPPGVEGSNLGRVCQPSRAADPTSIPGRAP